MRPLLKPSVNQLPYAWLALVDSNRKAKEKGRRRGAVLSAGGESRKQEAIGLTVPAFRGGFAVPSEQVPLPNSPLVHAIMQS